MLDKVYACEIYDEKPNIGKVYACEIYDEKPNIGR
jgi:hypothetical protein